MNNEIPLGHSNRKEKGVNDIADSKQTTQNEAKTEQVGTNLKAKFPKYSIRIAFLSVTALVVTYTHFFGVSYLNSKMAAAGFEGIAFDLSTGQSMYFAVEGYTEGLAITLKSLMKNTVPFLIGSFLIGIYIVYTVWKASIDGFFLKFIPGKSEDKDQQSRLPSWLKGVWEVINAFGLLITVTLTSYVFQILLIIAALMLVAVLLAVMRLGNDTGKAVGERLISGEICKTFEWSEQPKEINKLKGCRRVPIKGKEPLKGLRVHKQGSTEYLVTNAGAFEIEDLQIISFRPLFCRPSKEVTEDTTCK